MAVHESQSLLMEMQVCRGVPFLEFAAPVIADVLGSTEVTADVLESLSHRVCKGLIRVDADELTYPCT